MLRYNANDKSKSPMKQAVNCLLERIATPSTEAVVIDAETLLSSKALVRGGALAENVRIINSSKEIIKIAKKNGHKKSVRGISTKILSQHHGPFDVIYLDYCGTPDPSVNGFLPQTDFWWMSANLSPFGVGIVTFSKRTCDPEEKARLLAKQSNLHIMYEKEYFETSAMYMMIVTKLQNEPLRCLFETLYESRPVQRKSVTVPRKTLTVSRKSVSVRKKSVKQKKAKPLSSTPLKQLYFVGDYVGVFYHMKTRNGKIKLYEATVREIRKRRKGIDCLLAWDSGERPSWVNQKIISKKIAKRKTKVDKMESTELFAL